VRKLQDEVNTLKKRNCDLENLISKKDNNVKMDVIDGSIDGSNKGDNNFRNGDELQKVFYAIKWQHREFFVDGFLGIFVLCLEGSSIMDLRRNETD